MGWRGKYYTMSERTLRPCGKQIKKAEQEEVQEEEGHHVYSLGVAIGRQYNFGVLHILMTSPKVSPKHLTAMTETNCGMLESSSSTGSTSLKEEDKVSLYQILCYT